MRLWAHEEEPWACLLTNKHQSAAMVNYVVCGATRNLLHCFKGFTVVYAMITAGFQILSNCVIDCASPDDALHSP